jgi:hypothetical protein
METTTTDRDFSDEAVSLTKRDDLVRAVTRLRERQRTYFRTRSSAALTAAKEAEAEVDRMLLAIHRQPTLF